MKEFMNVEKKTIGEQVQKGPSFFDLMMEKAREALGRFKSEEREKKALMVYDLAPELYLKGIIPPLAEIEKFLEATNEHEDVSNKVLLARAFERIVGDENLFIPLTLRLGRGNRFCYFDPDSSTEDTKAIIINTDHPSSDFPLDTVKKQQGIPVDPMAALELFKALIDAEVSVGNTRLIHGDR